MWNQFKKMDHALIVVVILLAAFGVVMVYSASFVKGYMEFGDAQFFFKRQLFSLVIGISVMALASYLPYRWYGKWITMMVVVSLVLLVAVLTVGVERNHSQRWLHIGPVLLQPTEMIKLVMLLYFAYFYSKRQRVIHHFREGVAPPLILLAVVFLLVLQQPDLGTASAIAIPCGFIVWSAGVKGKHLFILGSIAGSAVVYFALTASYRLDRILSFRDPLADPNGEGYQLIGSYKAIASGGWTGRGLGNSVEKMGYLPEAHTDFIMSIVLEELGLIGLLIILGGYVTILYRGVRIAVQTKDTFGKLLAVGLTFQIGLQAVFNLGAVSGLLPITGITLPFISYGGSSLIVLLLSAGILVNISTYRRISVRKKYA
ncbi:UNVERIFIED_CONTAM: putative lipid II flippase FtsW [Halobacillus marinus]|uniref:putative lipid II flippase FtsW n=1 Tax=Bacillaceae TaxID=186817 RepID=UPI0002A51406|nr:MULTISPECIES: putative lipid II flippase FtsW [Bacillaceae]ELK47775.1 cell division protein FtsW [Halobacillus sp. BAB-2008]QHT45459.1 putative lipid II flippase FtsW [Bacillus sp. SB49]